MRFVNKKSGVAAGVLVVALAVAGVAAAYWTTTGAGGGSSTAASSNGTVVLHASFPAGQLAPGTSVPVSFTADNVSATNLYVTSLTVASITTSNGACLPADFSVPAGAITQNTLIPASSTAFALPNGTTLSFANSGANQDACKGATVTLNLTSD